MAACLIYPYCRASLPKKHQEQPTPQLPGPLHQSPLLPKTSPIHVHKVPPSAHECCIVHCTIQWLHHGAHSQGSSFSSWAMPTSMSPAGTTGAEVKMLLSFGPFHMPVNQNITDAAPSLLPPPPTIENKRNWMCAVTLVSKMVGHIMKTGATGFHIFPPLGNSQ